MFLRLISKTLSERLDEPKRFIQELTGPRQTGKTTMARQIISGTNATAHYASADELILRDRTWIQQQWEMAFETDLWNYHTGPAGIEKSILFSHVEIQSSPSR